MDVVMPKIGQAMSEGVVVEWFVADGGEITTGQPLVAVETDKTTLEIESQCTGTVRILVEAGHEVAVGTPIARIGDAGREAPTGVPASPKARAVAGRLGVDLGQVRPTRSDGVIGAADVEQAAANPDSGRSIRAPARTVRTRRPLTGIRRASARRLSEAWKAPHIVQMVDVDASALLAARQRLAHGESTIDLVVGAVAASVAAAADLNATVVDGELALYDGVDVGIAVDTPHGLVVPVIRDADRLPLAAIAAERRRLIEAARAGTLRPGETGDASVTVSNLGPLGIRFGTPVLNLGEPVLVVVGAIEDRAVVVDGAISARPTLTLSIAYDHRVTDGAAAARHTTDLKDRLERIGADDGSDGATASGTLRISSAGDGYRTDVDVAGHRWTLDEPVDVGGTDRGPDPIQAFLGALAGCMVISLKAVARRRGVPVLGVSGTLERPPGKLTPLHLVLDVVSPGPPEAVAELVERAKRGCSVSRTLGAHVELHVDVRVSAP